MSAPLPVTLLSGFLGSGKTTLLNRLLADPRSEPCAVVVNEFGDVGLDGALVRGRALVGGEEPALIELANGCVCCTVRGDLERALLRLQGQRRRLGFRHVLIETSGLAAPGPIARTLRFAPRTSAHYELRAIVTVCHGERIAAQLRSHPEARRQVAVADVLVASRADRVPAAARAAVESELRAVQPAAVEWSAHGVLESGASLFDVRGTIAVRSAEPEHDHEHVHSAAGSVALTSEHALDLHAVKTFLAFLANRRTHRILRLKGILRCAGQAESVVVQGLDDWLEIGPGEGPAPERSCLVVIGIDLDRGELERGFAACRAR